MKKFLYLPLILILGLLIRLDFLIANEWTIDSDEAIVGLMAKNILLYGDKPIFYYGQHYLGSLEAFTVSIFFKFFGISNYSLKIVPLLFSILFIYLVYLLTKEVANKRSALFASLFASIAPATLVIWSGKARGGFIEVLFFGALILLLSFKWQKLEKKGALLTSLISFLFGVSWWVNNQILYFIPAVGIIYLTKIYLDNKNYIEIKNRNFFIHFFVGLFFFFLGSILFWIYNFTNDFASFGMFKPDFEHFGNHIGNFFKYSFPILVGAKRYWTTKDIVPYLSVFSYVVYSILILCSLFWLKRKKDYDGISFLGTFFVVILTVIFVFSISQYGSLYLAPRYLLPLYVVLFPLLGIGIENLYSKKKYIGLFFLFLILGLNLFSDYAKKRALLGEPLIFQEQRASDNHDELISWLKAKDIHLIRTNYWIGYRLSFETNEDVKFLVAGVPKTIRIKSYENLADNIDKNTVPVLAVPREARYVRQALKFLGYSFLQKKFDSYRFIYNIKKFDANQKFKKINNEDIAIEVSDNDEAKRFIMDKDVTTRWGSAKPQNENMFVKFNFKTPKNLKAFTYSLGNFETDFPRKLEVWCQSQNGEEKLVINEEQYEMLKHYLGSYALDVKINVNCENTQSFILKQKGTDTFFDWSIAEISLYEK